MTQDDRHRRTGSAWAGTSTIDYLVVVALALALVSYWAPWVDHDTAALKLSGQDLGEFVKFIPAIRRGLTRYPRQLLYLPPFAGAIALVLLAANRQLTYPRWLRVGMLAAALLVLPGLLPPAWGHPRELFASEFRLQGTALLIGALFVLAHGLFHSLSLPALAMALVALSVIALIPPQWAFWRIRPQIWAVYDTASVRLGWGLWLDLLAWAGSLACGGLLLWTSPHRESSSTVRTTTSH
jgi:hypothetical protein